MSARRRPTGPRTPPTRAPKRAPSRPWVVRVIAIAAVLVVVAALVITIATGTLFTSPR